MRRLVPEFILNNLAAGELNGELNAVVLFADITGFSVMTEELMNHGQHGTEVLAGMMRRVFEPMIASVYQHYGFVSTLAGDAITAIYPIQPSEYETANHALASAAKIQESIEEHPYFQSEYGRFDIAARVGIAMGHIGWAIISSDSKQRAAYYFRGPGIENCSKVEQLAQPGQIAVDQAVGQYIEDSSIMAPADGAYRISRLIREPALPDSYIPQKVDLNYASRFFPSELIQQSIDGEFRQVVNLFVNLPTIRTRNQLRIFMFSLFKLQDRFGGLLNRMDFGDKGAHILIFWGAPQTYENDVDRALDFALALQEETSIPIHVGITYRNSHAGFVGSSLREEYTCYGKGINLAARFMVAAPRGKIWVDENIASRAKNRYSIEFLEKRTFKGFSKPQPVFMLNERKKRTGSLFHGEMVGRHLELEQLEKFLQPLHENKFCGTMVIEGEAGIGKSRLVYEIQSLAQFSTEAMSWAICYTRQHLQESFNPFRYLMRALFDVSELQGEARNKRSFNHHLDDLIFKVDDSDLVDELDRTRSFLAALIGLYWPDSLYAESEAQIRYENTLAGLAAILRAMANIQPVILLLEDVHWLDPDSRIFIDYLITRISTEDASRTPLAILATARPGDQEKVIAINSPYQKIGLNHLPEEDITYLAAQVLNAAASPKLIKLLIERTSGNPFFIEQILRYLVEKEGLRKDKSGWEIDSRESIPLPADVKSVLVARLDRLEQDEKEIVHYASVLGREFDIRILEPMLLDAADLIIKMTQCQQKGIWTPLGETRYIFNHALMQDAAYRMQTRNQRAKLHALAVESIKNRFADDLNFHYGELAFHSETAGDYSQAFRFYRLAAGRAIQNFANQEAITNLDGALKLYKKVSPPLGIVAKLYAERGHVRELTGAFNLARTDYENSLQIAINANEFPIAWESYIFLGKLWSSRDYQKSSEYFHQALSYARQSGDPRLIGSSLNWMGNWYANNEDPQRAISHHREALSIFQHAGEKQQIAESLDFLGMSNMLAADLKNSSRCYSSAIELYREMNDRPGLITSLMGRGANTSCLYMLTTIPSYLPEDAFRDYQEAIQLAKEIGSPLLENGPYWVLGILHIIQGNFRQAHQIIHKGYQLSKDIHHREWHVSNLYALGVYYLELFAPEAAISYLEEALQLAHDLQSLVWVHWITSALAKAHLLQSDLGNALANLNEVISPQSPMDTLGRRCCWVISARTAYYQGKYSLALEITEHLVESSQGFEMGQVITYLWMLKAEILAKLGDREQAIVLLEQAKENASQAGEIFLLWRIKLILARFHREGGNLPDGKRESYEAQDLVSKVAETIDDEVFRASFLEGAELFR